MHKKIQEISKSLPCFICFFLAILVISTTLIYFVYKFNNFSIFLSLAISFSLSLYVSHLIKKYKKEHELEIRTKLTWVDRASLFVFLLFSFVSFFILFTSASDKALISPWQVVPEKFFLFYGISAAALFVTLARERIGKKTKTWLIRLFYFLSFSVCLFIYKNTYGFDPFIHQATMEFINEDGFISPKNPYYIGQYGLVIALHKISGLSIAWINTWLLSILAAFLLPLSLAKFLKEEKGNAWQMAIPAVLVLGFSPFIMSAPQNLAYLFLIISLFAGLKGKSLLLSSLFALATLCIHPLAGLPALAFLAFSLWKKHASKLNATIKITTLAIIFIGASLIIPTALFLGGGESLSFAQLFNSLKSLGQNIFSLDLAGRENLSLNFSYLLFFNKTLILALIALTSFFLIKKVDKENHKTLSSAYLSAISLLLAFLLSATIKFKDVISYEQNAYGERLLLMAFIFMLPSIALSFKIVINKILQQNAISKLMFLIVGTILLTASLYISYPRIDRYYNSRGYSTSYNDILAVEAVENMAREDDLSTEKYIVLANQQVSAAALKTFGFKRYIQSTEGEIYFYPIPTGGTLYQYYLKAVYEAPTKTIALEAMDFAQTNAAFLVINKYWNRSAELINEAKVAADSWENINDEVFVFYYRR